MNQIDEFFRNLFDTSSWPPRWKCGYWSDFHGWLYIVSELMIWIAYFLIPLIIINYFSKKKASIRFRKVYLLFASFILLCGSTHFFDAMMFWIPMYRFNALIRLSTGVISLFTVFHLVKILPDFFRQKTNMELEKEITLRVEAEQKLAEANEGLQTFAYIASHDLQEPLRKIRVYASILQQMHQNSDAKSQQTLEKLVTSTARMQNLIKDVLSLSSLNHDIVISEVNIGEAVNDAMEDLEVKIKERAAIINVQTLPTVKGNKAYLSQLFLNLINNAIKFSEQRPLINIWAEEKQSKATIYVQDNGIGIDEINHAKVFEAFGRLHTKAQYEGTGIGLAICKRIVDIHKGTIELKSKVGEGTTFIVALPLYHQNP